MLPSVKKNLFQDKVENEKATFGIGAKRALLGLVVGSVASMAASDMQTATSHFALESSTSPIAISYHGSHSSHSSHASHTSSRSSTDY